MKKIALLFLVTLIAACSSNDNNFIVKGTVKGLKKGTLYLQKVKDTALVTIDSVQIIGSPEFELGTTITEPEIFYLILDKNDTYVGQIKFFANKGITEINTTLKNFAFDAEIKGSDQHIILEEYMAMTEKYNSKNLDLIKANFEAISRNDSIEASETGNDYKNLLKSKYLYTINFALNNKTSQVAPYLALTEIYDAQLKYLDTIYVSLPDSIATSKYGKELKTFISERRALEDQN